MCGRAAWFPLRRHGLVGGPSPHRRLIRARVVSVAIPDVDGADLLVGWLAGVGGRERRPCDRRTLVGAEGLRFAFMGGCPRPTIRTERRRGSGSGTARRTSSPGTARSSRSSSMSGFLAGGAGRTDRRPPRCSQAATDRGFDAIVVGEYERAFCGSQLTELVSVLNDHDVRVWLPEAGGAVDLDDPAHQALDAARVPIETRSPAGTVPDHRGDASPGS